MNNRNIKKMKTKIPIQKIFLLIVEIIVYKKKNKIKLKINKIQLQMMILSVIN